MQYGAEPKEREGSGPFLSQKIHLVLILYIVDQINKLIYVSTGNCLLMADHNVKKKPIGIQYFKEYSLKFIKKCLKFRPSILPSNLKGQCHEIFDHFFA